MNVNEWHCFVYFILYDSIVNVLWRHLIYNSFNDKFALNYKSRKCKTQNTDFQKKFHKIIGPYYLKNVMNY